MKAQSAKAKGRRLQQWVRDQLIEQLDVHPEDIESRSMGAGTITQSALNMSYTATFVVEPNPTNGNLSNVLNSFMELGVGSLDIPLNITCTQNGTVTLDSLSIAWTEGASNIQVPDPPNLWIYSYNYSQVSIMWSNTTSPSDLMHYEVFRAPTGSQISINNPLAQAPLNGYQDTDGVTNQEWDYAVRSVHDLALPQIYPTSSQ